MLILAIVLGATVAAIIFWPIRKGGNGPPGSGGGGGGGGNNPPGGNSYLPMESSTRGYWVKGHPGVFAESNNGANGPMSPVFNPAGTNYFDFANGPGVQCNADACSYVTSNSGFASGNAECRLADAVVRDGCVNADYTIDGRPWFWVY